MRENPVDKGYLARLTKNTSLRSLVVAQTHFGNKGLKSLLTTLAEVPNSIRELNICGNDIDLISIETVELLDRANIEKLNASQNNLGSRDAYELSRSKNLKELNLSGNHIGDTGAIQLARRNDLLEKLNLSDNKVGDSGARALSKFQSLKELNVSTNRLTDKGLDELMIWGAVQVLDLDNQHFQIDTHLLEGLDDSMMDTNDEDYEKKKSEILGELTKDAKKYFNLNGYLQTGCTRIYRSTLTRDEVRRIVLEKSLAHTSRLEVKLVNRILTQARQLDEQTGNLTNV